MKLMNEGFPVVGVTVRKVCFDVVVSLVRTARAGTGDSPVERL
jgi:hypothetical protein